MTAFRSTRLALFHGWTASPLWERTGSEIGNLDLTELPVSDGLRQRLRDWNARCDEILSAHAYHWPDEQTHKEIVGQGSALATELRAELGIEIVYRPDGEADDRERVAPSQESSGDATWAACSPLSGETYRPRLGWPGTDPPTR